MIVLSQTVTGLVIILVAGPGGGIQNSWKPAGQRPRPFLAHEMWGAFARTSSGRRKTARKAALDVGCTLACGQCCESMPVGWPRSSRQVS